MLTIESLSAFAQVVMIDLAMAGDNAIIVGMAVAGLPPKERRRAATLGIAAAALMRIAFSLVAVQLLDIVGLTLVGGLLLLWVSWKMFRQLRQDRALPGHADPDPATLVPEGKTPQAKRITMREAITQIFVADVSMSLDNVMGVAGAAREHPWVLVAGLALSVLMMGLAAAAIVKLLHRWRWLGYLGLFVVLYVALHMVYEGGMDIQNTVLGLASKT